MTDEPAVGVCLAALLADPMTAGPDDVQAAVQAAAAAGFSGLSLWAQHVDALATAAGDAEAAVAELAKAGVAIEVVEAAIAWPSGDGDGARAEADRLAEVVHVTRAGLVLAACLQGEPPDTEAARRGLRLLRDRLDDAGGAPAVEFLPWTGLPDLASAWRLVEPLGPAVGLVLDGWHWQRQPGGPDQETLAAIPGVRVPLLQPCDAAVEPGDDLLTETMTARLPPGAGAHGDGDLYATVATIGARPVVAVETFNPGLLATHGLAEWARLLHRTTAEALHVGA